MNYLILTLNPGSTSTKFGVYNNESPVFEHTLRHSLDELKQFERINDQFELRKTAILEYMQEINFDMNSLSVVIGRGGGLKPIPGGTYVVDSDVLKDLSEAKRGEHASNLGGIIADAISREFHIPAYIADGPAVDELCDLARVSGLKGHERESKFHALNQKAVGRRFAKEKGQPYNDLNLIVAHLGGGISVGAHEKGRIIDVFDALLGDGAFSPERAGGLPTGVIMDLCLSGKYSKRDIIKMLVGGGGVQSYLGTTDMRDVSSRVEQGDSDAAKIYEAMAYQVSKDIGSMSTVLKGQIDQIILTGGITHDKKMVSLISERCAHLADITVYPGEDELEALAECAYGVMTGEIQPKIYSEV